MRNNKNNNMLINRVIDRVGQNIASQERLKETAKQ